MADPVRLGIFANRLGAIAAEMGAVLQRTALSPNIRDRLDYSCALFDAQGGLLAQAAHIPVHLGSMAFAMAEVVQAVQWRAGDALIWNDPFRGGTHLPDVTLAAPLFCDNQLVGFVANRAHHADIGSAAPGSMPLSNSLEAEGLLISPTHIARENQLLQQPFAELTASLGDHSRGDFIAQWSACLRGVQRLGDLVQAIGLDAFKDQSAELNQYAQTLATQVHSRVPAGHWRAEDLMDSDGFGARDIPLVLTLTSSPQGWLADFQGTAGPVEGNLNCPLSVTMAALFYVFRCLLPADTPVCAGLFRDIAIRAPDNCLINAHYPAAVAAGNVETSQRIVDLVLQALRQAGVEGLPADSQGTMNNLAMGGLDARGKAWSYYETVAGGCGAHASADGLDACQSHMTNTLNTPVESFEANFPVRLLRYQLRRNSGGQGVHRGGDGVCREYLFESDTRISLITERRRRGPRGSHGGEAGMAGVNLVDDKAVAEKYSARLAAGQRLTLLTPGGGGWGQLEKAFKSE